MQAGKTATIETMTDNTTLRLERLIDAPPEVVFRIWSSVSGTSRCTPPSWLMASNSPGWAPTSAAG